MNTDGTLFKKPPSLESSCKDWKRKTGAGEDLAKKGLESSCKDWKQLSTPLDFPVLIPLRIFL